MTLFARDSQKVQVIGDEFHIPTSEISNLKFQISKCGHFDIVVNATPVGMKGPLENETLFTADELEGVKFVYDLVVRTDDTPLVREAKKANVPAIGGLEMLLHQGAKQFEIWTGRVALIEMMREAALNRIDRT